MEFNLKNLEIDATHEQILKACAPLVSSKENVFNVEIDGEDLAVSFQNKDGQAEDTIYYYIHTIKENTLHGGITVTLSA